jgi:hypothetical protein
VTERTSDTLAPVTIVLLGSQLLTGAVAYLVCQPPSRPSLTWASLVGFSLLYVLIAAVTHAVAVWLICKLLGEHLDLSFRFLVVGMWRGAAWMPLWALLIRERSIWMASVPPLISVFSVVFMKSLRGDTEPGADAPNDTTSPILFQIQKRPSFVRTAAPAVITSVALQVGMATLVVGHSLWAGLFLAIFVVFPVWSFERRAQFLAERDHERGSLSRRAIRSLMAVLITGIPLVPFLVHNRLARSFTDLLFPRAHVSGSSSKLGATSLAPGDSLSGVILVFPQNSKREMAPQPYAGFTRVGVVRREPLIIPFDGVYWYFKAPDPRPPAGTRTVREDPTKANIRSTDSRPLTMEAHQSLGNPINLASYSSIRLAIRNADNRPGLISIELVLANTDSTLSGVQSLGTMTVRSSQNRPISLNRPPVEEILNFPIPQGVRGRSFNQITALIKPSKERARAGAQLAVQHFELDP